MTTSSRLVLTVLLVSLVVLAAFTLFPIAWALVSGLKTPAQLAHQVLLPTHPQWSNLRKAFEQVPFGRAMLNSVVVAGASTLGILATSTTAGYAFAKYRFRARRPLFILVLATMMVPPFMLVIPLYYLAYRLGWVDTYWGLILPNVVTGFGIFLMRQFVAALPDEILDAGRIDGANEFRLFISVVLPQLGPALAALGAFAFVFQWNTFLWPLTIVRSPSMYTIPLALNALTSVETTAQDLNIVLAGAAISIVPSLIVLILIQRHLVRGITFGSSK